MSAEESRLLTVLLVDDHHIVRAGLRTIIERAGIEVVGEAGTAAAAIEEAARLQPDVVLMNARLPDGSAARLPAARFESPIRRLTVLFPSALRMRARCSPPPLPSAGGYLLKEIGAEHLIQAIRSVASGLSVLGPGPVHTMLGGLRTVRAAGWSTQVKPLSNQEQRVLGARGGRQDE